MKKVKTFQYLSDNPFDLKWTDQYDIICLKGDGIQIDLEVTHQKGNGFCFDFEIAEDGVADVILSAQNLTPSIVKTILAEVNQVDIEQIVLFVPYINEKSERVSGKVRV